MTAALDALAGLPGWLVYLLLGVGAALENIVPPVPADTFVVAAGLLASRGVVTPGTALAVVWASNVLTALLVYGLAHRHGKAFFERGAGRWMLNEHQLQRIRRFYRRFGPAAIFFARFLPGLRAIVPAFAGVSHQPFLKVAVPVVVASGIWYGTLLWLGLIAGRNLERVEAWLRDTNRGLLAVAVVLLGAIAWWWWRTRHPPAES